jgi:broad specificity phosphatase PhoE
MRHGQTDWNIEERFNSITEVPLNAEGRRGVSVAAHGMVDMGITRIVSSPMLRCVHTAEIVRDAVNPTIDIEIWNDLREVDFGDFEGLSKHDLNGNNGLRSWFSPYPTGNTPPNAETWTDAALRARSVLSLLAQSDQQTLVVSHGYILRLMIVEAIEISPPQAMRRFSLDSAHVSTLSNESGYWRLLGHNMQPLEQERK